MKKTVFAALLACLMLTSCEKIVGDLDFLDHDFEVQGTISPTLGVPVAHGSISVYDILQMVQVTEAEIEYTDDGIVTIVYDTVIKHTAIIDNGSVSKSRKYSHRKGASKGDIVHNYVDTTHNSIQGAIKIDIFDNIDSTLNGASIEVDSLLVSLGAYAKAVAREGALEAMQACHVGVFYDSLYIIAVGKSGNTERINLPNVIPVDSLIEGQYLKLFDKEDIGYIINMRPVEIRYGVRMNIAFEAEFYNTDITAGQFVADSIGIDSVNITADIEVAFPISTSINNLSYNTDLRLNTSIDFDKLTIDSSMLILTCDNGLPLYLDINATLMNVDTLTQNTTLLSTLLDPSPTTLAGAPVGLDAMGHYTAVGKSHSELRIPITATVYNDLLNANAIRIEAILNTSQTGDAIKKRVAIKSSDMLDIMVTAKIKPNYPFTFGENGNDDNDNNNSKSIKNNKGVNANSSIKNNSIAQKGGLK